MIKTFYTDGNCYYSDNPNEFTDVDYSVTISHEQGDFYVKILREDSSDFAKVSECVTHCSLDSALDGWACNCDEVLQVRGDKVIFSFSTSDGNWAVFDYYDNIINDLRKEGVEIKEDM